MARKSKKSQDERQPETESVELPEERLDRLEQETPQSEAEVPQGEPAASRKPEQVQVPDEAEVEKVGDQVEVSGDDLLDDIRQSLVEEEVEEPKGFLDRIKDRFTKSPKSDSSETESQVAFDLEPEIEEQLQELSVESKPKRRKTSKPVEEEKAIQDFFADLEALADIDLDEELETRAGQESLADESQVSEKVPFPRLPEKSVEEDEVDFDAVREMALQEYDETRIEVEERKPGSVIQEELRQTVRELKPVERRVLIIAGIVTALLLLSSGMFLIASSITLPTPVPTATVDLKNVVHPAELTLPGGWNFRLGQGTVSDGQWTPKGAEWLVGTEISRWVALPWSLQLEAVLRTLKSSDQLELAMSNSDVITYTVYSIQELSMGELLATDPTKPSLVVVLYNDEEAEGTFWVVTALP